VISTSRRILVTQDISERSDCVSRGASVLSSTLEGEGGQILYLRSRIKISYGFTTSPVRDTITVPLISPDFRDLVLVDEIFKDSFTAVSLIEGCNIEHDVW
jgi:hypothetical protein